MFVTFEGSEGSGKTTQLSLFADFLREQGYSVITTREPGGTNIGEQVRQCLHDVENRSMTAAAEVLLYSASRAQLVKEVIRPALVAGHIVLSDRYADSTIAYQGYGRRLDLHALKTITAFATGNLQPDATLLFDVDVEAGLLRRTIAGLEINRMDLQKIDFYRRVRQAYLELAEIEPWRWLIIDANRSVDEVQADVRRLLLHRIQSRQQKI